MLFLSAAFLSLGMPVSAFAKRLTLDALKSVKQERCAFLHVWAIWCPPCKEEMPRLLDFLKKTGSRVTPVVVDVTSPDRRAISEKWVRSLKPSFGLFHIEEKDVDAFLSAVNPKWEGTLPYSVLYRQGKIAQQWEGPLDFGQLDRDLKKHCP